MNKLTKCKLTQPNLRDTKHDSVGSTACGNDAELSCRGRQEVGSFTIPIKISMKKIYFLAFL